MLGAAEQSNRKNGTADQVEELPGEHHELLECQIAEMPELGQSAGEQAAALAGLAPIARDSGHMRGKRMIGGGRRAFRQVLQQATPASSNYNADLKVFAGRLRRDGKSTSPQSKGGL